MLVPVPAAADQPGVQDCDRPVFAGEMLHDEIRADGDGDGRIGPALLGNT
jgi:hypothetical protein